MIVFMNSDSNTVFTFSFFVFSMFPFFFFADNAAALVSLESFYMLLIYEHQCFLAFYCILLWMAIKFTVSILNIQLDFFFLLLTNTGKSTSETLLSFSLRNQSDDKEKPKPEQPVFIFLTSHLRKASQLPFPVTQTL